MAYTEKWTQHLETQEEKDNFYRSIMAAKPVLNRLKDMIEEKETSMNFQEMSQQSYENPNWAYLQAHQNGFRQCLTAYKRLLETDQKETRPDEPTKLIRTTL